jgi:ubiquinone/menaquinone biosynthesis C-methylase UbiE
LFSRLYRGARKRNIQCLNLGAQDRVLIVGAGTGLDLPLLPRVRQVVAIDMSRDMLRRARTARGVNPCQFVLGDAQRLPFQDGTFDAATLHLILAVAPDGRAVLSEATRAVRPKGLLAVMDKFAGTGKISLLRRLFNIVARQLGTDITRDVRAMLAGQPLVVKGRANALAGLYLVMCLERIP